MLITVFLSCCLAETVVLGEGQFHPVEMFTQIGSARPSIVKRAVGGGHWVFGRAGKICFSAYFHEQLDHAVSLRLGRRAAMNPSSPIWAPPGSWAVTWGESLDLSGTKAFYKLGSNPEGVQILDSLAQVKSTLKLSNVSLGRQVNRTSVKGGKWMHGRVGDTVFSAFFHPKKRHMAALNVSGVLLPTKEQWAAPGKWALIQRQMKSDEVAKALYVIDSAETNEPQEWEAGRLYSVPIGQFKPPQFIQDLERQLGRSLPNINWTRKLIDDGGWLYGTAGDIVFSAYYHKLKPHAAFVQGGENRQRYPVRWEWAPRGHWAVVYAPVLDKKGVKVSFGIQDYLMPPFEVDISDRVN